MRTSPTTTAPGLALLAILLPLPLCGGAQEATVYRHVSAERLEKILRDMKVRYAKSRGKQEGAHYYDFERNGFKVRLHNYQGTDLWIDCAFTDLLSPEQVNGWNVRAKFSRAVRLKHDGKQNVSLESQLDCQGGVTDAVIRQFILRFDGEVKDFVQYCTG